ncbi:TPA: pentapeptide repeat-containing protein [Campylobacter jejuni]|nr:pentapeptide repeat-containing protein [Campylobacter jejuni]
MIDFSYAIFENEVHFCNTYFESVVHFSFTKFKGVCDFSNTKFLATQKKEERNRICFDDTEFEDIVHFYSAKFESKVLFCKSVFKSKVNFNGAEFSTSHYDDAEINNFDNVTFESDAWFNDIIFNSSVLFSKCEYKGNIYMRNITSKQQLYFYESLFLSNVYFNNSHFKDYVNFCECEFEKTACFYGVKFDKTPNFSQAIFKGNLNAVNTNLNFTFDDLQERIKQEYAFYETQRTAKEAGVIPNLYQEKSLDKFANDFRDSFRIFKNALIKDNNLLDASNFHKYELYCKEIELKNKKGKTFKDVVDRWQLLFYRKLCDHHTDILQSLNSLILVIGIFVISSVAMVVGFNYSLGYKPILEHWYFSLDFYNHHINSIIQDNYLFVATVNLVMLFGYLILVGFALCLKYMREFFIIISYVITLLVLAISPKILIPAMGIFTDKRAMLDPLSVFSGIYTIIFGFVAFSFIKTIRKNSIVPS